MQFIWLDDVTDPVPGMCPVCHHAGPHRQALRLPGRGPESTDWLVLRCPHCDSRFSTWREPGGYGGDQIPEVHLYYYLEQGAGLRAMLEPLAFAEPRPRRMLEIGGGLGFPSDYVQTLLGWTTKGYDPSGLAVMGQRYLGLDITCDYWTTDTPLTEPFDVAYASEVIEHIPEPAPFLASIYRAVGETGIAVLTTPNGAALSPATPAGMLMAIASPMLHMTLFSAKGLELALRAAGFSQVRVAVQGFYLHAFASNATLPDPCELTDDQYRAYLKRRIDTPDLAPSLLSGLRYRLLREQVNAGDGTEALALYKDIAASMRDRFGIDIERPADLRLPPPSVDGLQWLTMLPGNITGLLYARGVLANNVEGDARSAALYAGKAVLANASMQRALRPLGVGDPEAEMAAMTAMQLFLTASASIGADGTRLLTAVERGSAEEGLLLPNAFRRQLREKVARDLRATRHPEILWRALVVVEPGTADEATLLTEALAAGLPPSPVAAFDAIGSAPDADSVRRALWAIWSAPHADKAPASLSHARKLTLIRLVQLGAFTEAERLFNAWGDPTLANDGAVADALAIAAEARRTGPITIPVPAFAAIECAEDPDMVRKALWTAWTMPGADEMPAIISRARKLALIRLVQLEAYADAKALFEAWGDRTLTDDAPVANALAIANLPR